ncbi:hypothetical protein ACJRO7_004572 [Eucalyptus globulus]|uniref:Uncharacterized protein n=1 Tax=Eucalyptus globulus TaxID=34317 RepID=A0ABD3J1M8_EUCGL
MMILSGDDQEKVIPRWLRPIAGRNYYCRVCMLAFCKDCKQQHDCSKHEILTNGGLEIAVGYFWYLPGHFQRVLVAFIYKKGTGISRSRCKSGAAECESCRCVLKSPSAKYCSMECKVEAGLKMNGSGNMDETAKRNLETTLEENARDVYSFRKRARKQEELQRAPFH